MTDTAVLHFDATDDPDLLDQRTWGWLRDNWWVCAYYGRDAEAASVQSWAWCLSPADPRPVPNPDMRWRRPTYGEAMRRVEWLRRAQAGEVRDDGDGSKYRRRAEQTAGEVNDEHS